LLTGSYPRQTKIYPLDDIDILLIRNTGRVGLSKDGSGPSPNQALDDVADAIRKAYPLTATIKKQSRSINTQIKGLDFGFDITQHGCEIQTGIGFPIRTAICGFQQILKGTRS
jgi:hypothetical protein